MTVLRDLMTTQVAVTTRDASVAATAADMVRASVGSAIVMQGSFLAGILTERDVLRAAASGEDLSASAVSAWMTPDPEAAGPDTSVEEAAQIMLLHGFRHLPVVDGRAVCGIVSLRDLFAAGIRRPLTR
jgi:CBS domain-containing protein